jgi:hypothetical protein
MTRPESDPNDAQLLERYRKASDADPVAPTEAVRAAILAEARRVAEQAASAPPAVFDSGAATVEKSAAAADRDQSAGPGSECPSRQCPGTERGSACLTTASSKPASTD